MLKTRKKVAIITLSMFIVISILFFYDNGYITKTLPDFELDETKVDVNYAISTASELATEAAKQILEMGGNAADAAVTVSYMLSVTNPYSSGLGGGGSLVIYDPIDKTSFSYDFYNSSGYENTGTQIGIPGLIKGMELLNEDYGTIEMNVLLKPAIMTAKNGFTIDQYFSDTISYNNIIGDINDNFLKNDRLIKKGDILYQPDLANVIENISKYGSDYFYGGKSEVSQNFMALTGYSAASLADYSVYKNKSATTDINGYIAYSSPQPFSGISLLQMLKYAEIQEIGIDYDASTLQKYNHMVETVYHDNGRTIGDIIYNPFDYDALIEDEYVNELSRRSLSDNVIFDEHISTTSFSIIDNNGMSVSVTQTLSDYWGSLQSSDGLFYNNSLTNFTNRSVNSWGPMKRPKSFIAPIIIRGESMTLALGSAGGQDIPQVLYSLVRNILENEMALQDAIDEPRFVKNKDLFYYEKNANITDLFEQLGYDYAENNVPNIGAVSIVAKNGDIFEAGYESRLCGERCKATH